MTDNTKLSKKRVSKACDCCRKSKTKCDGMRPCKRCLEDGKICTYMNKKKEDKMYPASYVDLLETRVSVLVQALTQLLAKSQESEDSKQLIQFCQDPQLLNKEGTFDLNKVICSLLSSEKLDNLAESNHNYSIDEITNVTCSSSSSQQSSTSSLNQEAKPVNVSRTSTSSSRTSFYHSPSPPTNSHHYPLSKAKQNAHDHVRKSTSRRSNSIHHHPSNVSSLSSSFQTKFTLGSPTLPSPNHSAIDLDNSSLDITHELNLNDFNPSSGFSSAKGIPIKKEPLDFITVDSFRKSLQNNVNDNASSSTLSPIEQSDSDIFSIDTLQSFDNDNNNSLDSWAITTNELGNPFTEPKINDFGGVPFQAVNGLSNPYQLVHGSGNIKIEQDLDPFGTSLNMTRFEKIFD